jgi:hypothetical protein
VVNLDDSRHDEYVRLSKEFDLADRNRTVEDDPVLADFMSYWPYVSDIYLGLPDKQLTAMKRLKVSVKADNGSCEAHLIERTLPCGAVCWSLDQTASTWEGILILEDDLDEESSYELERVVAYNAKFPLPMVKSLPSPTHMDNDLSYVELFHNSTMTVKTASGSHDMFMEQSEEIYHRLRRSRSMLDWGMPPPALRRRPQPGVI